MAQFKNLNKLIPLTDDAFQTFYDVMLKDSRLSIFFDSEEQIKALIGKQKSYFIASLGMSYDELRDTYIRLGEFHYHLKIPYSDFSKGSEILQEHFVLTTYKEHTTDGLVGEIYDYFKMMKAFTAKGYLNKMLEEDSRDIDLFSENIDTIDQTYLPNKVTLNKINWLKGMLGAIKHNTDWSEETKHYFQIWKKELQFIPDDKRVFFGEMEERILYDTQNLFYFLEKQEYTEILPLYTSLLNIYKLSLILNNALTLEYANKVIDDLKLDKLTLLFRKDLFEMMVVKEMALVQRDATGRFQGHQRQIRPLRRRQRARDPRQDHPQTYEDLGHGVPHRRRRDRHPFEKRRAAGRHTCLREAQRRVYRLQVHGRGA